MRIETRVGLFVLSGAVIAAIGIFFLGDFSLQKQYQLTVIFNSVEGLPDNAAVKVSGVEVGKVAGIILEQYRAKVTVRINSSVRIHEGASAAILSTGLIGTKYVSIYVGDVDLPVLKPGSVIYGKESLSYEEIFSKAMDGIDELKKTFSEVRGDGALGKNLNEAVERINNIARRLDNVTEQHDADIRVTLGNFREISEKLNDAITYIQSIAKKIDSGEGIAAKLVNDPEMGQNLKETVSSLKNVTNEAQKVLGRITLFRTYWDYRLRYDTEMEQYKSDLGLKISPRKGKYYFVGVNNAGDKKHEELDEEEMNTITAEIGREWGLLTVHGGIIRSQGGVGVKIRPVKRLELTADAYNFAREKNDKFSHGYDTPVYDVGGNIKISQWLFVGGQAEDVKGDKNFNAYVNLVFEDEDVAYLLGFVGLAR